MFPEEDVLTVRRWADRKSEVDVLVDIDGLALAVVAEDGELMAELRWHADDRKWRLHIAQHGELHRDQLSRPTADVEQLLACIGLQATERWLG